VNNPMKYSNIIERNNQLRVKLPKKGLNRQQTGKKRII